MEVGFLRQRINGVRFSHSGDLRGKRVNLDQRINVGGIWIKLMVGFLNEGLMTASFHNQLINDGKFS